MVLGSDLILCFFYMTIVIILLNVSSIKIPVRFCIEFNKFPLNVKYGSIKTKMSKGF